MNFKDKADYVPSQERVEQLREKLRRTASEQAAYSWRLEALDRLIALSQVDPLDFHRLWILPLLDAGVSMEVATACVVQAFLLPN